MTKAYDQISRSHRIYQLLSLTQSFELESLRNDILAESKRQRQWLHDLKFVLKPIVAAGKTPTSAKAARGMTMTDKDLRAKSFATALEDHSAEGIQILSSEPSRLMQTTIYLIFSLLAAGVAWSFIGRADVIVASTGNLEPESDARRVYSPLDGELVDIYMAEGMPVEKGDVLARVDAVQAVQVATQALQAQLKLVAAEEAYRLYPDQEKRIQQKIKELKTRISATGQVRDKLLSEGRVKLGEKHRLKLQKSQAKLDKAVREMELAKDVWKSHERLFNSPGQGGVSKTKSWRKEK